MGWRASMLLVLMAMAFGVIAFVPPVQDGDRGFGVNAIPTSLAGWAATDGAPEEALPRDPNETVSFRRTYREGDRVAWVSVALFVRQDDPKRRASLNLVHPEANAKRIEGLRVPISLNGTADTPVTLPAKVIHAGDGRLLVVHWYQIGGRIYGSEYWYRLALLRDVLVERRADTVLVRIAVPADRGGPEGALRVVATLAPPLYASVSAALAEGRAR